MENHLTSNENGGFGEIAELIQSRRQKVARMINKELIELYWDLGKLIFERIVGGVSPEWHGIKHILRENPR